MGRQERGEDRDPRHQEDDRSPERAERPPPDELARSVQPPGRRLGGRDVGEDLDGRIDRHEPAGYRYRIRGSIHAKVRSTRKLTMMKVAATRSTRACVSV